MASTEQKLATDLRMRRLLDEAGVPAPDAVEYGHTCIWLLWHESKLALRIDIDLDPDYDYPEDPFADLLEQPDGDA